MSAQPLGDRVSRSYVAFHWHPQLSGAWQIQVSSTLLTPAQYSSADHGDFAEEAKVSALLGMDARWKGWLTRVESTLERTGFITIIHVGAAVGVRVTGQVVLKHKVSIGLRCFDSEQLLLMSVLT